MGFITEFFASEASKSYEDPAKRRESFLERLKAAQDAAAAERAYADFSARPKYRFGHLQLNPFYEQRNRMYPHRRYERRGEGEQAPPQP